jgi:hypothetical protein
MYSYLTFMGFSSGKRDSSFISVVVVLVAGSVSPYIAMGRSPSPVALVPVYATVSKIFYVLGASYGWIRGGIG